MGKNYWNRWSIKHWQERGKMGRGSGDGGDGMWLEAVREERRAESLGAYNLGSARQTYVPNLAPSFYLSVALSLSDTISSSVK